MIFECATQDDGYEPTQRENDVCIATTTKAESMQQESGDACEREEEEPESGRMQQESGDDDREREEEECGRMLQESGDACGEEEEECGRMPQHTGEDFRESEGVRDVLVCSTPERVGCDDEHSSGSEIPGDDCELVCETQCGEQASDGEKSGTAKSDEVKDKPLDRFSSLDAFFSSLSVVGTAELVEMCCISGITDVEALFNCLPDDYEQWPSALRLVCDIFVGSCASRGGHNSGVAFSGIGAHGIHVAEFYAKMLDYGSTMLGPKRKKKGKQTKRKDADDDSGETSQAKKKVRVDGAKSLPKKELYRLANGPDGLSVLKDLFSSEHFDVHVIRKKTKFAVGGSTATVDTENLYYFGDAKDVPSSRTGGITLARVGSGRKDKIEYFPGRPIEYVSNVDGETLSGRKHTEPN